MAAIWKAGASWVKDPDEVVDQGFDWTDVLPAAATISDSDWLIDGDDDELEATTEEIDDPITQARFEGGTLGVDYTVTNHVEFSNGEKFDRSWTVRVRAQ